jgi:hypothetical protein
VRAAEVAGQLGFFKVKGGRLGRPVLRAAEVVAVSVLDGRAFGAGEFRIDLCPALRAPVRFARQSIDPGDRRGIVERVRVAGSRLSATSGQSVPTQNRRKRSFHRESIG